MKKFFAFTRWLLVASLCLPIAALAHGDEPHGEAPHPVAASSSPGFEAATEAFEIVGRIDGGQLLIWVQRFETNAPVLGATLQLEAAGRKLAAPFDAARGVHVIQDAALLQALQTRPGPHALMLTLQAGEESDLIPASLTLPAPPEAAHEHTGSTPRWRLALVAGVLLLGLLGWWRFHRAARTELKEQGV